MSINNISPITPGSDGATNKQVSDNILTYNTKYCYIEVAFSSVSNRNKIIRADELDKYIEEYANKHDLIDCYATYFRYSKEILDYIKQNGSVRGFAGSCYANFLPIDIDSLDLKESLEQTKILLTNLTNEFDVDLKTLHIYFSGAKGFHVELPSLLFGGFIPSPLLPGEFKKIARLISDYADLAIYDKMRLWRLPNTVNSKSNLYKIALTIDEIFSLKIEEIKELAKSPRKGIFFDDNATENEQLTRLYKQIRESYQELEQKEKRYVAILNNSKICEGERNSTLTSLCGKLKSANLLQSEAAIILNSINQIQCLPPLPLREVENIIKSVYRYETNEFEFKTQKFQDLIGKEEPEIDFLIEDLLPRANLIILAGKPKLGKSLLALQMSLCVALKRDFLDKKVKQGSVLFISTEDSEIRLKKRIWKMLGNPNEYNKLNFHFYIGSCILTDKKVMQSLKSKVQELKPDLIVLDPLINLFQNRELNSAEDMNQVLRPLQTLARESGACVLVVHHARKSGGDDIDVVQGSITISGVADGLLILKNFKQEDNEKRATLEAILKDAEIVKKVVLKLDPYLTWQKEGEVEEIEKESLEREIIKLLQEEQEGLTIAQIAKILNRSYFSIYRELTRLSQEGKVASKAKGKSHKNFFSLCNVQNVVQNENAKRKCVVSNGNDSINSDEIVSLCKLQNLQNEKINLQSEKLQNLQSEKEGEMKKNIERVIFERGQMIKIEYDHPTRMLIVEQGGRKRILFDDDEFFNAVKRFLPEHADEIIAETLEALEKEKQKKQAEALQR